MADSHWIAFAMAYVHAFNKHWLTAYHAPDIVANTENAFW